MHAEIGRLQVERGEAARRAVEAEARLSVLDGERVRAIAEAERVQTDFARLAEEHAALKRQAAMAEARASSLGEEREGIHKKIDHLTVEIARLEVKNAAYLDRLGKAEPIAPTAVAPPQATLDRVRREKASLIEANTSQAQLEPSPLPAPDAARPKRTLGEELSRMRSRFGRSLRKRVRWLRGKS